MEYTEFGQTGLSISRVGVGCAAIGGYDYGKVDDRESIAAIHRALDLGINFFDTADAYGLGHSEEVLGRALGARRREVVVATKVGVRWDPLGRIRRDLSPGWVVRALEGSLRRLKMDCIPVYQIHWPDPATPVADTLELLRKSQEAGKIRFIGCCNFPESLVDQAQAVCRVDSLQLPYSLAQREFLAAIRYCHSKYRMAVLAYSPLAQGLLSAKYTRASKFEGTDLRARSGLFRGKIFEANLALVEGLKKAAGRIGRSPAQVAIRWILEEPAVACALAGVKRPQQVEENAGASGWNLSRDDVMLLERSDS